jgi:hypothetical protein
MTDAVLTQIALLILDITGVPAGYPSGRSHNKNHTGRATAWSAGDSYWNFPISGAENSSARSGGSDISKESFQDFTAANED